jgi:hypothetical protein
VFGKTGTDNTTLSTAQIPTHNHGPGGNETWFLNAPGGGAFLQTSAAGQGYSLITSTAANSGGGGAHGHGMDMRINYVDVIVASKD